MILLTSSAANSSALSFLILYFLHFFNVIRPFKTISYMHVEFIPVNYFGRKGGGGGGAKFV
jgi:hypothetical protein